MRRQIIEIGLQQLNFYKATSVEPTKILLADIAGYEFMLEIEDNARVDLYYTMKKKHRNLRPRDFHRLILEPQEPPK